VTASFSTAFMEARIALGNLPDCVGGTKVALVCMAIDAAGLAVIWLAHELAVAPIGVALNGLGHSLIYRRSWRRRGQRATSKSQRRGEHLHSVP
jgi:hypothetical protein